MWFDKTGFSCWQKCSSHVNSFNVGVFSKIPSGNDVILHPQNFMVPRLFNPSSELCCNFGGKPWNTSLCSFLFFMKVLSGRFLKVGFGNCRIAEHGGTEGWNLHSQFLAHHLHNLIPTASPPPFPADCTHHISTGTPKVLTFHRASKRLTLIASSFYLESKKLNNQFTKFTPLMYKIRLKRCNTERYHKW